METETLAAVAGNDFSLYELFLRADIVVKFVMGLLVLLSIWTWGIAIDKWLTIGGTVKRAKQFELAFWSGQPIEELDDRVEEPDLLLTHCACVLRTRRQSLRNGGAGGRDSTGETRSGARRRPGGRVRARAAR